MADGRGVARLRVAPPRQPRLLRRRRETLRRHGPGAPQRADRFQPTGCTKPEIRVAHAEIEDRIERAIEIDLPGHVGPSQPELTGRGDEAMQCVRTAEPDRRLDSLRPERAAVPEL